MRKVLASLIIATLLLVLAANSVLAGGVIKFGADVGGTVELSQSFLGITLFEEKMDTETGISVGGEWFFDLNDKMTVGAGAEYQLNRKNEGAEKGFNFIPIYALGRYQIDPKFYLTGKVGYNILQFEDAPEDLNLKGGLFFGFGGGAVLGDVWQLEVLYSIHNGGFPLVDPLLGVETDFCWKYTKIGASIGYKF